VPQNAPTHGGRNFTRRQIIQEQPYNPFSVGGTSSASDEHDGSLRRAGFSLPPPMNIAGIDHGFRIESIIEAFMPNGELSCNYSDSDDVPRICGAWVAVLPRIAEDPDDRTLSTAVRALSSSISSKADNQSAAFQESVHAYTTAVVTLRANIQKTRHRFNDKIAAAIMCLTLVEVTKNSMRVLSR
jgi:hypothetical protein